MSGNMSELESVPPPGFRDLEEEDMGSREGG